MKLIDKSKIDFTTIEPYEYASEPMEVAFKEDIERLSTVKAIPTEELEKAREKISELDGEFLTFYDGTNKLGSGKYVYIEDALEIIDKLIESEE